MSKFIFSPGLWLFVWALFFLWRSGSWSKSLKNVFLAFGLLFFYFTSTPFLFYQLSFSWERKFEVFDLNSLPKDTRATVVVLGAGFSHDSELPKAALLGSSALARLVEAVRIARFYPQAKIHTSGNSASGKTPGALYLKGAAMELGIEEMRITMQPEPKNTREEAQVFVEKHFSSMDTVILVTSAIHIPRARKHFLNAGVKNLFVAPSDYLSFKENTYSWHNFLPSMAYWNKYEQLTKEFVGYYFNL
jgi:uncharacterized SAM-binding protein YcdF (DUF218 family)